MAATSDPTPRANGFTFSAEDELTRLRAAVDTLSDLVLSHGIMSAESLKSLLGGVEADKPAARPVSLPPPAQSATAARSATPVPASKPVARPVLIAKTVVAPTPAPLPGVAMPVTAPVAMPAAPTLITKAPVAAEPVVAAPVAAAPVAPAPVVAAPVAASPAAAKTVSAPAPVVAPAPVAAKTVTVNAPVRVAAPPLKRGSLWSRLFGAKKTSPSAIAASAEQIEFTERMPKLPFEGLYDGDQRSTEVSFPPVESIPRRRSTAAKKPNASARPAGVAAAAPSRFCERCWRRIDSSGTCKTCPSA